MKAGDTDLQFGYLSEAYRRYAKAFDYSKDSKDRIKAAIGVCLVSIGMDHFNYINRYCEPIAD